MATERDEPLLEGEAGQQQRLQIAPGRYAAMMAVLFLSKWVLALGMQSILVFAPFLAKEAGDLTLAQYRVGLAVADAAALVPIFLPLQDVAPRTLASASLFITAVSTLLPQTLLIGKAFPLALAACRFFQGLAACIFSVMTFAMLGTLPEGTRTKALAWMEVSWFLAGFGVPVYGEILERGNGAFAVTILLVVPSLLLSVACFRLLPASSSASGEADREKLPRADRAQVAQRMTGLLVWILLFGISSSLFMCNYGTWLHVKFGMSAADVGMVSNAIAAGYLMGNFLTQLAASAKLPVAVVSAAATGLLSVIDLVFLSAASRMSVWMLFGLIFCFFSCTEWAFLTALSHSTERCGAEKIIGQSLWAAAGSVGKITGDWLAPYPSMSVVFASGAAMFLCAAGSMLTTARKTSSGESMASV